MIRVSGPKAAFHSTQVLSNEPLTSRSLIRFYKKQGTQSRYFQKSLRGTQAVDTESFVVVDHVVRTYRTKKCYVPV